MPETLPALPLPDDVIDKVAKELAAQVADHIEALYPEAAKAVAWRSASASIQGVVRNGMASAGRAAEEGRIEGWLEETRRERHKLRRARRQAGWWGEEPRASGQEPTPGGEARSLGAGADPIDAGFEIVQITDDAVFLQDLDGEQSVANDAVAVVQEVAADYPGRRILVRDTLKIWGELLHDGGEFTGFGFGPFDIEMPDLEGR